MLVIREEIYSWDVWKNINNSLVYKQKNTTLVKIYECFSKKPLIFYFFLIVYLLYLIGYATYGLNRSIDKYK